MVNSIKRGATPVNRFLVNVDLREATVYVTYEQRGRTVIEKTGSDLVIAEKSISVPLSQKDTLALKSGDNVDIQIRYVLPDGTADNSNILTASVERVLKDGVITYV